MATAFALGLVHRRIGGIQKTGGVGAVIRGIGNTDTQRGGDTATAGTASKQAFPADQHSKTMFAANNMQASSGNTWFVEITPGKMYRYGLKREGREFEVEFDLTKPVATPPTPWGHQ